jgi:muconate cycloisomerase
MALSIHCPKCRAGMKVDEKHLGMRGRCSKCGEVFTMTANSSPPGTEAPAKSIAANNPFMNPFGGGPVEPSQEAAETPESRSGFFGFQFSAPPPPSEPTPKVPSPIETPIISPFEPFARGSESEPPPEPLTTFEPMDEPVPLGPAELNFRSRIDTPPPVVLEMVPPGQAPLMEQKIATVETFVVKLAGKRTLRGAHGPVLREGKATTRLYIRIGGTNGDAVGWAEANPLLALQGATVESAAAVVRRFLRPAVEGLVLADRNGWLRRLERASPNEHGPSAVAKAVVEVACLDLLAKTLEAPLAVVWGGAKTRSIGVAHPIDGDSTKSVGDQIKRGRDRGATAFHLVFADGNESKERNAIAAMGKSAGEGVSWSVGFLKGHPRDAALRLCEAAASAGATAVRGALDVDSSLEIARLAERTRAPIVVDVRPGKAFETASIGAIAGVLLTPSFLGWRRTCEAAVVAQSAGLRVWLAMQFEGALGTAAVAHLAAALGIDAPIIDSGRSFAETPFVDAGAEEPIKLSDEPGVGIAVDETLLRAAAVEVG